ncbi:31530_t:CDS:2, partial [Gigaspora margarita]
MYFSTKIVDHKSESSDNTSVPILSNKKQKIHEPNFDKIWIFYLKGSTSCYYCSTVWKHGKPQVMKAHLANYCKNCPKNISNYWHQKLIKETNIVYTQANDLQDMDCFSPKYDLPSCFILSEKVLEVEVALVTNLANKVLEHCNNLILNSIYNYIVSTIDRKEYLLKLKNYSSEILIGEFLLSEISDLIEDIGIERFAIVVTDTASNC